MYSQPRTLPIDWAMPAIASRLKSVAASSQPGPRSTAMSGPDTAAATAYTGIVR